MAKLRLHIMLRKLLEDREVSMRTVSMYTDIPQATLSGYLNGAKPSKLEHVRVLSKFFNISMEDLLFGEGELQDLLLPDFTGWLRVRVVEVLPDRPQKNLKC